MYVLPRVSWRNEKAHHGALFVLRQAFVGYLKSSTMKFSTALVLASLVHTASAFSAAAPASNGAATGTPDPVEKSMRGIDTDDAFDPTGGDSPAVSRNNNDEVWVPQVREQYAH
jgi:hypothetical protein